MSFTESKAVEQMILDAATSFGSGADSSVLSEKAPSHLNITLYGTKTKLPKKPKTIRDQKILDSSKSERQS